MPTEETMSEGSPMSPMPAQAGPGELSIPVGAVAVPDEGEQMVNPEPGDKVTLQVEAEVVSVDGDRAIIRPTSVNGQELAAEEAPEQMEDLQRSAEAMGALS
jgi:hypothetical protein